MTKQELLDVLKMDEQEQLQWLCCRAYKSHSLPKYIIPEVLAFSLRDKAVEKDEIEYGFATMAVFGEKCKIEKISDTYGAFCRWLKHKITPIEIIIASLIVLEAK